MLHCSENLFQPESLFEMVELAFDHEVLKRICEMSEKDFAKAYGMTEVPVLQKVPNDFYYFRDNGSDVLAVAHLDTVGLPHQRTCRFLDTEDGTVVYSRALDDRLGAYIILELLPTLGITYDILLTVGEENGQSTAAFFDPPKQYDWMIEFDRGGTDVVMYQYDDDLTRKLVKKSGARVGDGIFSDICYLEHLGIKGFNWGVGYQDYHGPRSHAYLDDTFSMVAKYLRFHEANAGVALPHEDEDAWWAKYLNDNDDDPRECDVEFGTHDHDDEECARLLQAMSIGVGRYPLDDVPAGTPESWIPDNPDEDGYRQSDFI